MLDDWFPRTGGLIRAFVDGGSSGKAADESSGGLRCVTSTFGVEVGGTKELEIEGPGVCGVLFCVGSIRGVGG